AVRLVAAVSPAIDHPPLSRAATQNVEGDVCRHAGRPGCEAACAGKPPLLQGKDDLFEGRLDEIVVRFVATPEHLPQGAFHNSDETVVDLLTGVPLATLEGVDQLGIALFE